jgi:RNA polymerase sigma-70 factor (ECF subfamily)
MSHDPDSTRPMNEAGGYFATTRWTQVFAARDKESPESVAALEQLCRAYWRPLYSWLRRQGRTTHDAQDLTQEFFARLLEKDWLSAADREKGRFRTFLLVALKRFLADQWDRAQAQKRGGGRVVESLDTELIEQRLSDSGEDAPDRVYERQWAMTLLDRSLGRLRREFEQAGRQAEFDAMKDCLTAGRGEIAYGEVAARLNLQEGAARVAVHRLRKRFRELFRQEIAETVAQEADIEDELRQLLAALAR